MRRFLSHKRKFLPLFCGLLIIGVLIGTMITLAGSAESGGYAPTNITRETFTSSSSGTYVKKANIRSSLLSNGKHFYPHSSNDNKGNDLLIEFSLLWNESMKNLKDGSIAIGRIGNNNGGDAANAFYFNCGDNLPGEWSPYAGSFECGAFRTVEYGPEGTVQQNAAPDQYPYIGEDGWHRIGVVFDMSLVFDPAKQDRRDADPHGVLYYAVSELYIDGVCVWEIRNSIQGYWHSSSHSWKGTGYALRPNRALPFMAIRSDRSLTGEFGPGGAYGTLYNGVWYVELDSVPVNMYIEDVTDADDPFFVAVSDVHWSCGGGFVRQVSPVSDPTPRTVNLGGENYPGTIWYVFDN